MITNFIYFFTRTSLLLVDEIQFKKSKFDKARTLDVKFGFLVWCFFFFCLVGGGGALVHEPQVKHIEMGVCILNYSTLQNSIHELARQHIHVSISTSYPNISWLSEKS